MDMVVYLKLFWLIILGNVLMYSTTILVSHLWSKYYGYATFPLTMSDVVISIKVLIINMLVAVPGLLLLESGRIVFETNNHFVRDLLLLFFGFDLLMYGVHRLSHEIWPLNQIHDKHHEHAYFNSISLYVMEPMEAILFGALLTLAAGLFDFNLYSFVLFLIINWLLGVIGHLNSQSKNPPQFWGNYVFHKVHHQKGDFNFGFYTVLWDRVFGTFYWHGLTIKQDK